MFAHLVLGTHACRVFSARGVRSSPSPALIFGELPWPFNCCCSSERCPRCSTLLTLYFLPGVPHLHHDLSYPLYVTNPNLISPVQSSSSHISSHLLTSLPKGSTGTSDQVDSCEQNLPSSLCSPPINLFPTSVNDTTIHPVTQTRNLGLILNQSSFSTHIISINNRTKKVGKTYNKRGTNKLDSFR